MTESRACSEMQYHITEEDLPLSCPPRDERLWDAHPRIYLPIEETGSIICPYCGTQYHLKRT